MLNRVLFLVLILSGFLMFSACTKEEAPRLSAEDQALADDALAVADDMYALRQDATLDESTRETLKQLYIEHVYTKSDTLRADMHYIPNRMKDAQKYLGGVSDYELDWARVARRGNAIEVQLKLHVYGNKHNTTEWVKLRLKPDSEEWMRDNGDWIIVSHQIRM